jgi:hypothetical protein
MQIVASNSSRVRVSAWLTLVYLGGCVVEPSGMAGEDGITNAETESGGRESSGSESGPSGDGDGESEGESETAPLADLPSETSTDESGGEPSCNVAECMGKVYACGDCIDNDDDGLIDGEEPECWGPCDNNESGFKGNIPGQSHAPCTSMDCYFDGDSGSGNDGCTWSHACDPSQPNPSACEYDASTNIPGSGMTCEQAQQDQDAACEAVCGPLTPNGCDCFGCCEIVVDATAYTVYLGSGEGEGTCTMADVADPTKCAPCVQVDSCLNPCEPEACELCIGQTELPDDCDPSCPDGLEACDPAAQNTDCPFDFVCISGCCHEPVK